VRIPVRFVGECTKQHTEVLVHSIVTDEIRAFCSLLCHEQNDSTVGLNFLDRFCLFHKRVNVVHDLNQTNNVIVAVHLSQDGLRKSQIRDSYGIQRTRALCVTERIHHAILAYVWIYVEVRSCHDQRLLGKSVRYVTSAILSTSSENNLSLWRIGPQVFDTDSV
jgi:hypothetical protein